MKIYKGVRTRTDLTVRVHEGSDFRPLTLTPAARLKSPTGFEWGYVGAGPAALSLSILTDALGRAAKAETLWGQFMDQVVSKLAHDQWELSIKAVLDWATAQVMKQERPAPHRAPASCN